MAVSFHTAMANAQKPTSRTRHMDIWYHVLCEWVERDLIVLERVDTTINEADHFTKLLSWVLTWILAGSRTFYWTIRQTFDWDDPWFIHNKGHFHHRHFSRWQSYSGYCSSSTYLLPRLQRFRQQSLDSNCCHRFLSSLQSIFFNIELWGGVSVHRSN